jgi:hypothetical protein
VSEPVRSEGREGLALPSSRSQPGTCCARRIHPADSWSVWLDDSIDLLRHVGRDERGSESWTCPDGRPAGSAPGTTTDVLDVLEAAEPSGCPPCAVMAGRMSHRCRRSGTKAGSTSVPVRAKEGGQSGSKPACGAHHRMQPWKEGLDFVIDGDALHVTDDWRLRTLADLWRRSTTALGRRRRTRDVPSCGRRFRTHVRGCSHEGVRVRQRAVRADPIPLLQRLTRHVTGGSAACREEPEAGHAVPGGRDSTSPRHAGPHRLDATERLP